MSRPFLAALAILAFAAFLLPAPGGADDDGPTPMKLDAAQIAGAKRIETFLNKLDTLKARILQVTSEGGYAEGELYIDRPGKLRIEYAPPVPVLIVADGTFLVYYDRKLNQTSHILLSATPASILVAKNIKLFSDELIITGYKRESNSIRLTVVQADDPFAGSLTLVFTDEPLTLRKWIVNDAQGVATTVSLVDTRTGMPLADELFEFVAPEEVNPMY